MGSEEKKARFAERSTCDHSHFRLGVFANDQLVRWLIQGPYRSYYLCNCRYHFSTYVYLGPSCRKLSYVDAEIILSVLQPTHNSR
jgi:hypothetical protein